MLKNITQQNNILIILSTVILNYALVFNFIITNSNKN